MISRTSAVILQSRVLLSHLMTVLAALSSKVMDCALLFKKTCKSLTMLDLRVYLS